MSLSIICREIRNWFEQDKIFGTFEISNGSLVTVPPNIKENQYFRIIGSTFNDGVYQHPANDLVDETFDGAIWLMAVPKDIIDLSAEIDAWNEKYGEIATSPYTSESFGGYSYSKPSGNGATGENGSSWQSIFASRLNRWRKI